MTAPKTTATTEVAQGSPSQLAEHRLAAHCAARLWAAALPSFSLSEGERKFVLHRGQLDATMAQNAPLPHDNPQNGQPVTLTDHDKFEHHVVGTSLDDDLRQRPRTQVYEYMGTRNNGWFALTASQLMRLSGYNVMCNMFVSQAADTQIHWHYDNWFGIAFQLRGTKRWLLCPRGSDRVQEVVTSPGDVLILPTSVKHTVTTPSSSVHINFAILTEEPLAALL